MKLIHYSRDGYEGNYTYLSVCGKSVQTHQDNEDSSIHPEDTNCKDCVATREWQADFSDLKVTQAVIKRRIYIESDILHAGEFSAARRAARRFAKDNEVPFVDRVFSQVLDFAWRDLDKTWNAVKTADEIYATSSLVPLTGGYTGSPVIFNGMCEMAIKENVTGKLVIILNNLEYIHWDYIDIPTMKKAFKHNDLYMYNDDYELTKIDISKIKQ